MLRMQAELLVSPPEDFTGISTVGQAPLPASARVPAVLAPQMHGEACGKDRVQPELDRNAVLVGHSDQGWRWDWGRQGRDRLSCPERS